MGRELMAPRTDRTTRIPSCVASPVTKNHAAKGFVFVNLRNGGSLKKWRIREYGRRGVCTRRVGVFQVCLSSSSLLLSSLELSDAKVYEPEMRALRGTASHFCVPIAFGKPL